MNRPPSEPHRRPFGSTGASFPEIGFGAWAIGGSEHGNSYGPVDDATSRAAVERALELGIEVFDTADVYGFGHSEEVLGQALGDRGAVFTKAGFDFYSDPPHAHWHGHYLEEALRRSLQRLGRERVDLFQLHNPPVEVMRDKDTAAFLGEIKDAGLTRWTGISVHSLDECLIVADQRAVDAAQVPVSIIRQDTLDGVAELANAGIAVVAREPLCNGFLTGKYGGDAAFDPMDFRARWPRAYVRSLAMLSRKAADILAAHGIHDPAAGALSFVLAHEVSVVIPGAKTAQQVEENARGPEKVGRMPAACLEELYQLGDTSA